MREPRFLIPAEELREDRAVIKGAELHHLSRVLRLRPGAEVGVFDGDGRGYHGRLETVEAGRAVVLLGEPEDPRVEPSVRVTLMQGLLHGERMDWAVEKATETGILQLVPVLSERCAVKPRGGRWGRLERWRRIALASSKQSGRLRVPEILEPSRFQDLILSHEAGEESSSGKGSLRLLLHPGGRRMEDLVRSGSFDRAALLVGPEGGWSDSEVESASSSGWLVADLGLRTLRAETAAAVAVSLLLLLRN
jgi:16S rRNA (uracil1498-N3)-methyltransferase